MPLKVGFEGSDGYNNYTKVYQDSEYLIEKEDIGSDYHYHFYYKIEDWWIDRTLNSMPSYILSELDNNIQKQILKEVI